MNKSVAVAALAVSALTLASCSTEAANEGSSDNGANTPTTSQESPQTSDDADDSNAEDTETQSASETPAETTSASAGSSGRFDEAALKGELEGLGYQCTDDDDCTKTDGAMIYNIDIDDDSVDVEVQGNNDLDQHFGTILNDVGTAFGEYDFGGATWDEIQTWSTDAGDDAQTVVGNVELEHDRGEDDGIPTREVSIELVNS